MYDQSAYPVFILVQGKKLEKMITKEKNRKLNVKGTSRINNDAGKPKSEE